MRKTLTLLAILILLALLAWFAVENFGRGGACDPYAVSVRGTVADCGTRDRDLGRSF